MPIPTTALPPKPNPKFDFYIGIDPGRHTGIAVWRKYNRSFGVMQCGTFHDALDVIRAYAAQNSIMVIEDPNYNKPVFVKPHVAADEVRKMLKVAQDVGRNKEQAFLLIAFCEKHNIPVRPVRPINKKLDATAFQRTTGETRRINQHVRDAAMLVWNL